MTPKHVHEFTFTTGLSAMLTFRSGLELLCLVQMSMDLFFFLAFDISFPAYESWLVAGAAFKLFSIMLT